MGRGFKKRGGVSKKGAGFQKKGAGFQKRGGVSKKGAGFS